MEREIAWLLNEKYKGKRTKEAKKDIERIIKGEPIDYVIGFTYFLGAKIFLSYKPLIPRPETEFWAEKAVKKIGDKKASCLDLFCGSGAVGISVLKNNKNSRVDFADIDRNALKQTLINLKKNKIKEERYNVFYSNIFSNVKNKYDYIFANPPYISKKRISKVQKSVLDFEPQKALFGGEDGLKLVKPFLKDFRNYLKKEGKVYMEFDSFQKRSIEKIAKEAHFYRDQYGKWRYLISEKSKE